MRVTYHGSQVAMSNGLSAKLVMIPKPDAATRLLRRYLDDPEAGSAAELLEELTTDYVTPLLRRIVSSRVGSRGPAHRSHVEDVTSDATVAFLLYAEEMRSHPGEERIDNLEALVAMIAERSCSEYFRRVYPAFYRTRNKVRYLLDKYPELARWKDLLTQWICGLAEWAPGGKRAGKPAVKIQQPSDFDDLSSIRHPADMLTRVFHRAQAPMRFDDLVPLVARLWNVCDEPETIDDSVQMEQEGCPVDVVLARRQWLGTLWQEVCDLNPNQRVALLLNLRDGEGACAASLLVATGVASLAEIAAALDLPALEFAALWHRLPLSDQEIAAMLQLTRQQVINLRKSARERLGRRMRHDAAKKW